MFAYVLALGLMAAVAPFRLGATLFVISRPRPVQNLLAFGVGCLLPGIACMLIPLAVLHLTSTSASVAQGLATANASTTSRYIQISVGVIMVSIAAFLAVRSLRRRRQQAELASAGGGATTAVLESDLPPMMSRILGKPGDAETEGGSLITRLRRRSYRAWQNGSLWIAVVIGLALAGPQPGEYLLVNAVIASSGASLGAQLAAATMFLIVMIAAVDIIVVIYLIAPAKAEAIVQPLHRWVVTHSRKILIAVLTVFGLAVVYQGVAGLI